MSIKVVNGKLIYSNSLGKITRSIGIDTTAFKRRIKKKKKMRQFIYFGV
tara:strand:+ start:219 stop:365 length:147 start_codon:yes stop_codon:yes gene_type:complete